MNGPSQPDFDPIESASREHVAALDVLRYAKNAFVWVAFLAILAHIVSWFVFFQTDWLKAAEPGYRFSAEAPPTADGAHVAALRWENRIRSALMLSGFAGRVAVLVIAMILVVALLVALSAGVRGAASLARACVWSLVALAMLVPWVRMFEGHAAGSMSAFYDWQALTTAGGPGSGSSFLDVVRFLLCPVLVAVALLWAQHGFRQAYAKITAAPAAKLPIHEL